VTKRSHGCTALLVCAALLSGCATINFDYPKTESFAMDGDDTYLGGQSLLLTEGHAQSGFLLQTDGIDALATRLLLAERAELTIDAQYYLIHADVTGFLFIEALLRAADRGVRVRLLVDDILARDYDLGMAALDAHPNFEIRIFNPFVRTGLRRLNMIRDFRRINRRMHNKTFTVDNEITIIGGRNIAAEYFDAREDVNFGDLDAVAIGEVVHDVSRQFDTYWNDEYALPVLAFVDAPDDPDAAMTRLRQAIADSRAKLDKTPYAAVLIRSVESLIDGDGVEFTWADHQLIYDDPAKARRETLAAEDSIMTPLRATLVGSQESLTVISPYFVPSKSTIDEAGRLTARGVDVRVVTNSLASNNHAIVHSGYARTRKRMLKNGVELWEIRVDARTVGAKRAGHTESEGTLHTKGFIVDRKVLFLGSFNFDPRSAYINTELGVIIDSPELAGGLEDRIDQLMPTVAYQTVLDDRGRLRWIARQEDGTQIVYTKEPDTGFWTRVGVRMMGWLPIKGQL
jgi:putative cardiolipin synthase